MATNRNKTVLEIDGDNKGALAALDGTVKGLQTAEGKIKSAGSGVTNALSLFTAGINPMQLLGGAAIGAATGFAAMVKTSIDAADEINKLSQKTGMAAEDLSTLKYAGDLADVSIDMLGDSLRKLSVNVNDASMGTGEAREAFNQLSIEIKNADGSLKDNKTLLFEIADRFKQMDDGTRKAALAVDIFGRSGAELIPLLNAGSSGLRDMQQEARNLGLEIDSETAANAERFNDQLTKLKKTFEGLAINVMPYLIEDFQSFNNLVENFNFENFFRYMTFQEVHPTLLKQANTELKAQNDELDKLIAKQKKGPEIATKTLAEIKAQELAAKKLADEWARTEEKLRTDLARNTLPEVQFKFFQINQEFERLQEKFGNTELINAWRDSMMRAAAGINDQLALATDNTSPNIDAFKKDYQLKTYDEIKAKSLEVTDAELLNLALLDGTAAQVFSNMGNAANAFYNASGQKSKEWFAIQKGFSVAQAVINTYEGATKALAQGGIFGPIMAAGIIAFGLGQVAQILSTQPGSSGGGGSRGGSISTPRNTGGVGSDNTSGSGGGKEVVINVYGSVVDHQKFARELQPWIKEAFGDAE